jgi:hypothetical protein
VEYDLTSFEDGRLLRRAGVAVHLRKRQNRLDGGTGSVHGESYQLRKLSQALVGHRVSERCRVRRLGGIAEDGLPSGGRWSWLRFSPSRGRFARALLLVRCLNGFCVFGVLVAIDVFCHGQFSCSVVETNQERIPPNSTAKMNIS